MESERKISMSITEMNKKQMQTKNDMAAIIFLNGPRGGRSLIKSLTMF